jgi:hypothetical protein
MTVLLYVLAVYVAVCWVWGLYLAVRLYTGRRLSHLMRGRGARTAPVRPTTTDPAPHTSAAVRAAEAMAKSKAA